MHFLQQAIYLGVTLHISYEEDMTDVEDHAVGALSAIKKQKKRKKKTFAFSNSQQSCSPVGHFQPAITEACGRRDDAVHSRMITGHWSTS